MMPRHQLVRIFLYFTGGLLVIGGLLLLLSSYSQKTAPQATQFPPIVTLPQSLTARAAIIYDPMGDRILFAKNAGEPLPLASLTKLMAAQALLSEQPLDTPVTITLQALRAEGDSGLRQGEVWSLRDLLTLGLVASSNDAMAAAAASAGGVVDAMNRSAARLGLTQTYFLNPTGLDLDEQISGAYGSARDVAVLASAFLKEHPEFFAATAKENVSFSVGSRTLQASSTAAPLLSTAGFIGAKTGYTDLAGGNLVAAFDISVGHPLIVVVLGSTHDGRFEDIKTLMTAARLAAQVP